jgi:DNA-binding beta-propeller fold protein YncE
MSTLFDRFDQQDIAIESNGQLLVTNGEAVLRVDPNTGDPILVSGSDSDIGMLRGSGDPLNRATSIAVEPGGTFVVTDSGPKIVRVDPTSGDRHLLSGAERGQGKPFTRLGGMAVDRSGRVVVVDAVQLIGVDATSGDRRVISGAERGDGPPFITPQDIAVEPSGTLLVIDIELAAILRVEPTTGNRTILSRLGDRRTFTRIRPNGRSETFVIGR